MNIEIANKLLQLRKEKGLSQEQLAQKLGISRQAVSKWERAEASPDTDNLIQLAKLYGISLDELLLLEPTRKEDDDEHVSVGVNGIHVKENQGDEMHVSWEGIHVNEKDGHYVDINKDGVFIDGKKYEKDEFIHHHKSCFPFDVIIVVGILMYAFITGMYHPTWIFILLIPIFDSLVSVIRKRKLSKFAYPIFRLLIFFILGFYYHYWHPGWIVFLTIPCFYAITSYIEHRRTE